jgi:hypothetical protein
LTVCDDPGAYVAIMQSTLLAPRIAIHLHPRFDTDELMAHLAEVDIQHWETLAPNLAAVGPGWPWADAGSEAFAAVVGVIVHDRTAAGEPPTTSGRIEEIEVRLAGTRHDAEDGAGYQDAIDESADRLDMLALPEVAESPRRVGTVLLHLLELLPEEPPKTGAGWDRYVAFMNALGARTLDEEQADALAEMIQLAQRYDRMPSLTGRAFDSERLAHEFRLFLPHFVEAYDGMYLDVTGLKRLIDAKHVGGTACDDYQRALDRAGKA